MIFFKKFKLGRLRKKVHHLSQIRQTNDVSDLVLNKEILIYKKIGKIYDAMQPNRKFPYLREMAIESYRLAADLGDLESMRIVGERLLNLGKFWESMDNTLYFNKIHEVYKKNYFDEAFKYLNSANDLGDILSKRLLGLSYINGWGGVCDVDKGLNCIVQSLDLEDSWSRASQIFSELGLDKPEFFSKLTKLSMAKQEKS